MNEEFYLGCVYHLNGHCNLKNDLCVGGCIQESNYLRNRIEMITQSVSRLERLLYDLQTPSPFNNSKLSYSIRRQLSEINNLLKME